LGWNIDEDRGFIPQDIYVDRGVNPHGGVENGISIGAGRTLHLGGLYIQGSAGPGAGGGHYYVYPGGGIEVYGPGNVPGSWWEER